MTAIGDQRERHGQERRQQVEELVDVRRDQVFLGEQLDDVGQRLQQAVRADAVRAEAQLDVREHLALDPLQVGAAWSAGRTRPAPALIRLMMIEVH